MQNSDIVNICPDKGENMHVYTLKEKGEVKSSFQPLLESNQGHSSPGLICCNTDLANSFQNLKERTGEMGHTGHYLQKVLNSVTGNSRSKSLPSCLDSKKQPFLTNNPIPDESQDEVISQCEDDGVNQVPSEWFKTWPERGTDKFTNGLQSKEMSQSINASCHADNDDCVCDNSDVENHLSRLCNGDNSHMSKLCHPHQTHSSENSVSNNSDLVLFHLPDCNKPSKNCDNESVPPCKCNFASSNKCDIINPHNNPIPLTELLQNIPIAYSPITRQLHIINNQNRLQEQYDKREHYSLKDTELKSDTGVNHNCVPVHLERIEEERFDKLNLRQTEDGELVGLSNSEDNVSYESPRSTLQRVGTYTNSLSRTEASSFSSIVSSLSDTTPSNSGDGATGNLLDPDSLSTTNSGHDSLGSGDNACFEEMGAKPKRRGITGFFSRGVRIHTGVTTYTSREVMSPHVSSRPHALSQYLRQHIFREPFKVHVTVTLTCRMFISLPCPRASVSRPITSQLEIIFSMRTAVAGANDVSEQRPHVTHWGDKRGCGFDLIRKVGYGSWHQCLNKIFDLLGSDTLAQSVACLSTEPVQAIRTAVSGVDECLSHQGFGGGGTIHSHSMRPQNRDHLHSPHTHTHTHILSRLHSFPAIASSRHTSHRSIKTQSFSEGVALGRRSLERSGLESQLSAPDQLVTRSTVGGDLSRGAFASRRTVTSLPVAARVSRLPPPPLQHSKGSHWSHVYRVACDICSPASSQLSSDRSGGECDI
uniref:Uncharacterized protein n=1 Tax=Timema tahoe TaxID=61484 RepID=A0A7R9FF84_9NEOP|nr:unnamed protein product [Timema tahoe]